jgi:CHAT domain-containing protein/tetratricopeptide (TPR) repeat protein
MTSSAWWLPLAMAIALAQDPSTYPLSRKLIEQGIAHSSAGRMEDAVRVLREAVALATASGDPSQRGHALRALAQVMSLRGDLPASHALFDDARAAFEEKGDQLGIAAVLSQRGNDGYRRAAYEEAERYWLESLFVYQTIDSASDMAIQLRALTFLPGPVEGELAVLDEALWQARRGGDRLVEGMVRAMQGDRLAEDGKYADALVHTEEAVRLMEAADPRSPHFARALTSLGRLKRQMGDPGEALALNRRAVSLLAAAHDFDGAAQASHAMALAIRQEKPGTPAFIPLMDQALAFARRSTRALTLSSMLMHYADMLVTQPDGDVAQASMLLDEAVGLPRVDWLSARVRSRLLRRLGQPSEALIEIEKALAPSTQATTYERSLQHWDRSALLEQFGRVTEALDSVERAISMVEQVRAHLVPNDLTRQSYAEQWRRLMADRVRLLAQTGRMDDALIAAERGRARALVDLLASREESVRGQMRVAALTPADSAHIRGVATPFASYEDLIAELRRRAPMRAVPPESAALDAALAAEPVTLSHVKSAAATRHSHLLIYWVAADHTLIWVVAPDGRITSARSAIGEQALASLVRATWAALAPVSARAASRSADGDVGGAEEDREPPAWSPVLRGDGRLAFDTRSQLAFRSLDRALVAPVRQWLPRGDDSLITIVPHGPLFRLSFGPLMSPAGRYLIEDARLSYTPSVAALIHTSRPLRDTGDRSVVVADPDFAPAIAKRERLVRLAGASAEGQAVSKALGSRATLLRGTAAGEAQVRAALPGARVVHFATHGVIRDDRPMASFLALAGSANSPDDDGRLTTAEIYGLSLDAELVVLSACRSALGPVTGDGITGLARAFFAAGTRSVIASLWDLPDVVTAPLLSRFYREWEASASKAQGLRRAQLHVIRELRAGRMAVDTPAGRFVIPEHPSLWAGLVLVGDP